MEAVMSVDQIRKIYAQMRATQYQSLLDHLIKAAVSYARIRVDWQLANQEKRREMDDLRSRAHTAFIDACNILSRNMGNAGEDNSWRIWIGENRQSIGDFACYLHCLLGIVAR